MKDIHWHAAGIGFGVRGSSISDVITLFEGKSVPRLGVDSVVGCLLMLIRDD